MSSTVKNLSLRRFFSADFLAVYVATIALFLSQLPPVYELISKPQPAISIDGWASVSQILGRIQLYVPVTITNDGGRVLNIEKLNCSLINEQAQKDWPMGAITYVEKLTNQPNIAAPEQPFGRLRLGSNERWSHTIHCATPMSPEQQTLFQKISREMSQYIRSQPPISPTDPQFVFPEHIWMIGYKEFESVFDLSSGQYSITLSIEDADGGIVEFEPYHFVLEDNDIEMLQAQASDIRFGAGILFPTMSNLTVIKSVN